jgi:hypothetical protein
MTTGAQFAAFNLKQLVGFQDLGTRGLAAIRASNVEATQARWDVDGVFNTKLTMSAPAANQVQVDGTSKATDGLGHVLTISSAYKKVAQFQNTNAVVYHVGFMYAEIPAGLRINPRTGKPQFDRYTEEVGFAAAPTSVTDNGNGTITFNVNSVTEAAVSNAGRLVRVYKVVPADGATTFAMALEECTVAFGANNTITTVGKFGQTTVSTTAGDYIVVCMGPRVSRNTDLTTVSGVVYVGTVTGNGGTPVTFSNANQTLLKTFQDASQIVYTPSLWLSPGSTTVQLALDALVGGLQASTPSGAASGAARIGMYAPDWDTQANFGLGNVSDSTFSTSATLKDLGIVLNNLIRRRKLFSTKNEGAFSGADDSTGTSLSTQLAADTPWWLRKLQNAGTTPYVIGSDVSSPGQGSYIFGEFSDPSQASPHLRKTRINATVTRALSGGKWQRIWLDPNPGVNFRFSGASQRSGLILEDFGVNGGNWYVDSNQATSNDDQGFYFKSGVVKPKDETTKANASSMQLGINSGTNGPLWAVFENLLIYGPSATQTSPAGAGSIVEAKSNIKGDINAATVATQPRPLVYRDCVFVMQRTTDFAALTNSSGHKIVFENCHFFGLAGAPAGALIVCATGATVVMRDCVVFAPEGSAIDMNPSSQGCHATLENVTVVAGFGGSSTITAPCAVQAYGDKYGLFVDNLRIILGTVCFRSNASATSQPLVQFGRTVAVGLTSIRNVQVKVESAGSDLGWAKLVSVQSSLPGAPMANNGVYVDGLFVDCGALPPVSTSSNSLVVFEGAAVDKRLNIDRFQIVNIGIPVTTAFPQSLVECLDYVTGRCWDIRTPDRGAGLATVRDHLRIANNCCLDDVAFQRLALERYATALMVINGSSNIVNNPRTDGAMAPAATPSQANFIYVSGNFNVIKGFTNLPLSTAGAVPAIKIDGRDNQVCDGSATCATNTAAFPIAFTNAATRRNRAVDLDVHYDGTTSGAVSIAGPDSLVDSCTFYRSAGAVAAVANAGAGSVTGSTVTSTTL